MIDTEKELLLIRTNIDNYIKSQTKDFINRYPMLSSEYYINNNNNNNNNNNTLLMFFAANTQDYADVYFEYILNVTEMSWIGICGLYIENAFDKVEELKSGAFSNNKSFNRKYIINTLKNVILDSVLNIEQSEDGHYIFRSIEDELRGMFVKDKIGALIFLYNFICGLEELVSNSFFDITTNGEYTVKSGLEEYAKLVNDIENNSIQEDYIFSLYEPLEIIDNDGDVVIYNFDKYNF